MGLTESGSVSGDLDQRLAWLEQRVAELELRDRAPAQPALPVRDDVAAVAESFEAKLGAYWLGRIGIVSLITGVALLVMTYFGSLAVIARVALGYAIAGAIAGAGWQLARRHRTFGEIVFGGGLAIAYFVTYALHFVPALRVIDDQLIGIGLVAIAIAGIVATAHRMRSETVAGIALFLGLHTGMLTGVTALSLVATTLLAAGASYFLAANRWVIVPLSTVVAVYTTHATLAFDASAASADLRLAFVVVDFALFAAASLRHPEQRLVRALALVNWLGALLLGGAALSDRSNAALFVAGLGLAGACGGLALIGRVRRAAPAYVAMHVAMAIATIALALPARLDGWSLVGGWLALALGATALARRSDDQLAVLAALLVGAAYVELVDERLGGAALLACIVVGFAVERLHAPADRHTLLRTGLVIAVAGGLYQLVELVLPTGYHTLASVGASALLFAIGFASKASSYRWAAFAVLGAAALRLLAVELAVFSANQRILTFVVGGIALLAVSFVYSRRARPD